MGDCFMARMKRWRKYDVLRQQSDTNWLAYLRAPLDEKFIEEWSAKRRQMWSTPGFLFSAGKAVTENGNIVDENSTQNAVYG